MKKSTGYRLIFGYLGIFLIFVGVTCVLPLLFLFAYSNEIVYLPNFLIPGVSSIVVGLFLTLLLKNSDKERLGKHQDSVLLVLIWICAIMICSIPFFLKEDMSFSQAVFETTSGFSTIGLTVYKDFDCHLYVFYRSLLTLIGGVGLVLVITTAISNRYGLRLYVAEGHNDKLLPNLRKSALVILGIYLGIIAVGVVAYMIAGLPFFDAIVHSISAVATGGFSSKPGGLVELGNTYGNMAALEIISVVLMLLGATNFLTHFFVLTGQFKKAFKDCEVKLLLGFIIFFVPLFFLTTYLGNTTGESILDSLRHGTFTFFTSITTTGFSNVSDIKTLGEGTLLLVILMNIVGGGMGSTAGGVKQYRIVVAAKSFYWATKSKQGSSRMVYPHFIQRCGEEKEVTPSDSLESFGYIALYCLLLFIGGLLVTLFTKSSYGESVFEFSNAISSTGLSNGLTALNATNVGFLWVMIIGMFAGRLEILAIYFAFYRVIRDILRKETI